MSALGCFQLICAKSGNVYLLITEGLFCKKENLLSLGEFLYFPHKIARIAF